MDVKRMAVVLIGLLISAGMLAGCGAPAAGASTTEVKVTATDFKFQPTSLTLKAGQKVKLTMTNTGATDHAWLLKDASGKNMSQTLTVKSGETKSTEFTAPAQGTYAFLCDVPGHKELGMEGKVVVQ